jgi:hypothetical protein
MNTFTKLLDEKIDAAKVEGVLPRGWIVKVANGSGVERETVRSYVEGRTLNPRADTVELLLRYFGVKEIKLD